jgi:hypothetical protein
VALLAATGGRAEPGLMEFPTREAFREGWQARGESAAYCEYVKAMAEGERALLMAPELFSQTTTIATEETGSLGLSDDVGLRQSVGLRLRTSRLRRAKALRLRTEADCRRYRAGAQLSQILDHAQQVGLREGLVAEIGVLERRAAEAEFRLEEVHLLFDVRSATLQDLLALERELERIQRRLHEARQERAELPEIASDVPDELSKLVDDFLEADAQHARADAALREASAWDVDLRGGYDQFLNDTRDVPAFGALTVSMSLGSYHQKSAHERGLRRHSEWRNLEFGGVRHLMTDLTRSLEAIRIHAHERLTRVRGLCDDLNARMEKIASLGGTHARRHRDALWFEWVAADAEQAHLEARLPRLEAFLGAATGRPPLRTTQGGEAGGTRILD